MSLKKRVTFTVILSLIFNFLGNSIAFSETGFKAVGVKDNTKIISNQYKSKNGFKYIKDGVVYTTPAFDFHIFSKEANLNAHTNGNIATKDLVTNAAFGTSLAIALHINEENYFMNSANGINNIASDGNIIVGSNIPTSLEDNNNKVNIGINGSGLAQEKSSNVYKETSESIKYIDIDAELENLKVISKLFAENSTSNGVTLSAPNGENQTITVDGNLDNKNNYYLNVKASEIGNGTNKRVIKIEIPERKTLIINVDMANLDINYLQNLVTVINNHNNAEDVVRYENNVLWNLYDSSTVDKLFSTGDKYANVGISDYFMGTILSPNANIKYGAVNGSIIANKTQQNGQESHKWTFTGHSTELTKGTSATIEGIKKLSGKTLEAGMFSFNLLDENGNILQTVKNDKDGAIKFEAMSYDKIGDYKYKVQEIKGSLNGITYDEKVFNVTVSVSDDGNGNLVAKVIYPEEKVEFTNKYELKGANAVIEASKKLTGKTLEEGMFSFKLLDEGGNVLQTVKNDKDGAIKFEVISYDKIGDYKYKVQEVKGNSNGITYDTKVFDVTVNVSDDGNENLVAKIIYPEEKIEFTNKYETKSISVNLEATKKLTGKTLEAGMFNFNLLDEKGNVLQTVKNNKDGSIKFASISYDKVGDYKYKVQEVKGSLNGITYDERVFNVTVNVSDDGKGNLVAKVIYPEEKIEFTNKYEAKGISATIEGTKKLSGKTLEANMFSFNLLDENGNILQTVKNDKDGSIKFASISYEKIGDYKYKVQEVKGNSNGITYDTKVFDVTVNVSDDGNGNLVAKVTYPEEKIEFTNKYETKIASISLVASKKLSGKTLEANMFSFNLLDENGNILQTVKNDKDGLIKFAYISYDKIGDYKYKVQEVKGNSNGITYDTKVFDVTVNVSDDGNGNLVAKVIYPEEKILFENKVIKGSLEITKSDYETGKFLENAEITIRDAEGMIVAIGKTDKNGKVVFEGLEYGKYTYEETESPKGYILDNKKHAFEIKEDAVVVKYTLTNKKESVVTSGISNTNTPNTGDSGIATSLIILFLGAGGLFINNRRKIKDNIS